MNQAVASFIDKNIPVCVSGNLNSLMPAGMESRKEAFVKAEEPTENWTVCPEGIPDSIDMEALGSHLLKISVVKRLSAKDQISKALRKSDPAKHAPVIKAFPAPTEKLERLSVKKLSLVTLMAHVKYRRELGAESLERGQPNNPYEVWLINGWLRARIDRAASIMDEGVRVDGARDNGLTTQADAGFLKGEDALLAALASRVIGTGIEHVIRGMISRGWVKMIYQDIYDQGEHAGPASLALFGLASWLDSRLPLDLVYQRSDAIFKRHYGSLVYSSINTFMNELSGKAPVGHYKPLGYSLLAPDFEAAMNLIAIQPLLQHVRNGMDVITEDLAVEPDLLDLLNTQFGNLTQSTRILQHGVDMFRSRVEYLATAALQGNLERLVGMVCQVHAEFRATYAEYDSDDNDALLMIAQLKGAAEKFYTQYSGRPVPGREAFVMSGIAEQVRSVENSQATLNQMIFAGKKMREEITRLATEDPIRNREEITKWYESLEERKDDLDSANRRMGIQAREAFELIESELLVLEEAEILAAEAAEDEMGSEDQDITELLDEAVEESRKLSSQNVELKGRIERLEIGLAGQRNTQASNGMSDEVRAAMQAMMAGGNTLTTTQCLLLTKAMYPGAEIPPTAWSSAQDSEKFEQTDRLWESLSTLAGKYTDAIVGGTSDAEARKMFTAFQYAANESETTSGGQMRKHREFRYQGETVYFDQHLRFGVAQDVRKTIRVHFKIINGVLVIAYCGEHRKL